MSAAQADWDDQMGRGARKGKGVRARKLDIHGVLRFAGADPFAAEGSLPWSLAQVDLAVAELKAVTRELLDSPSPGTPTNRNTKFAQAQARNILARLGDAA